jgi:hypothetical protein
MSVDAVVARIGQIESMLTPAAATQPNTGSGGIAAPSEPTSSSTTDGSFASALNGATASATSAAPVATTALAGGTARVAATATSNTPTATGAQGILQVAASQVGVSEQPPGSNDGPKIATYRSAVAGAGVGPWCAQFASWVAKQAGEPLGEQGQGFQSVAAVYGWAQRVGRAVPAGAGVVPKPGDLIVWGGEHIGIVDSVDPNGSIHTIEGNSGDAVTRHTYGPDGGGATGYVSMS